MHNCLVELFNLLDKFCLVDFHFHGRFSWLTLLYKFTFNYIILFFCLFRGHPFHWSIFCLGISSTAVCIIIFLYLSIFYKTSVISYYLFLLLCWCCYLLSFHWILQVIFFTKPTWQILWQKGMTCHLKC